MQPATSTRRLARRPVSKEYIDYLEAKVAELEAQVRLCMNLSYYKDSRIRTLKAQLIDLEVKHREVISSNSVSGSSNV